MNVSGKSKKLNALWVTIAVIIGLVAGFLLVNWQINAGFDQLKTTGADSYTVYFLGVELTQISQSGADDYSYNVNGVSVVLVFALCVAIAVAIERLIIQAIRSKNPSASDETIDAPKDFSNPKKLGFMRWLLVYYFFNITLNLFMLTMMGQEDWGLDFDDVFDLINVTFDCVLFWLIVRRKQYTRQIAIVLMALNVITSCARNIYLGQFDIWGQIASTSAGDIITILYFATSRRAKAILVQPFKLESSQLELKNSSFVARLKTFAFWRNLIIYFCVFSVVGHWMEAGYCLLIKYGIMPGIYDPDSQIWRDWLYPFMVYGFGFSACVLILTPVRLALCRHLKNELVALGASFVVNSLVCGAIELAMGLIMNQPDAAGVYPLWDYSDMFCNFMGQICLLNTCLFGLVATLMTWLVYPALEKAFAKLPRDAMNLVFIGTVAGFLILYLLYYINILA